MKNNFIFKTKIWRWPGDMGWHFVNLPKDVSIKIRKKYPKGFVKIQAQTGKSAWKTSLFPHLRNKKNKEIEYLVCINKKILKKENLFEGDEIKLKINIL